MDVSIIIVNYNTSALTARCISSVYQHTKNRKFEIIVVDNASTELGIREISQLYPQVIFIFNKANAGFGVANNQGIKRARGKYIFLLNSDARLMNDAVSVFFNHMEDSVNLKIGCCGGELIGPDNSRRVSFGNFPTLLEAFSGLGFFLLFKKYFYRHISSGVFNYTKEILKVDYVCGAAMFLRSSVLDAVGSFDPNFFLYFEDTELSFRIKKAGYHSMIIPWVKIEHLEGGSQSGATYFNSKKMQQYAESRKIFFNKCYNSFSAAIINKIYAFQALFLFFRKGKNTYLKCAKVLFQS